MLALGLNVDWLDSPFYVTSPLSTWVVIDRICRDCDLEIGGLVVSVDLRVIDMHDFDVILGMDWLSNHRVVMDYYRKRIDAYTPEGDYFWFCGDRREALPEDRYHPRLISQLGGWLASLSMVDEEESYGLQP